MNGRLILGDLSLRHVASLVSALPTSSMVSFKNLNKVRNISTDKDITIFYNYRYRKLLKDTKCLEIYPNIEASEFCADRISQCKILDLYGGSLARKYYEKVTGFFRFKDGFVYKLGNSQQGEDKYLGNEDVGISLYGTNVIEEEYVQGRSIRLLFIGESCFVVEQISDSWLANVNTTEEIVTRYDNGDPLHISLMLIAEPILIYMKNNNMKSLTWGFDFIVGDKIGLLEVNDMCGIPEDKECDKCFVNSIISLTKKLTFSLS